MMAKPFSSVRRVNRPEVELTAAPAISRSSPVELLVGLSAMPCLWLKQI